MAIVGEIPQGLPSFVIPEATGEDVLTLLSLALALLVLSYVELSSLARTYARKRKYHVDTDQELLALGASSISTGFFYYLPETILAALIIMAVYPMVDFKGLFRIGHISKRELTIVVATLCGVLVFGILAGVLIGVLLSFIDLGYWITRPHTAVQGRISDTEIYGDVERRPEKEEIPGVLIIQVDAPLLFGNTGMQPL